jgi:hypothetical protein
MTRRKIIVCAVIGIVLIAAGIAFSQSRFNPLPRILASTQPQEKVAFPSISTTGLSLEQTVLIKILQQEYAAQPAGTKYSEGIEEPWCADFVSWVFKEADVPLKNPNSGGWRIPGTFTLREYYEQEDRFVPASSEYSAKVGDILLYDNPSPFGQHTNIVINNEDGVITTIGGNEPGGIRIVKHTEPVDAGFIGYGVFKTY